MSGACMRNLNVSMGDSRDEKGLKRFFPFTPQDHLIPSIITIEYYILHLSKFPEGSGKKDLAYEMYTKWKEVKEQFELSMI